MNNVTPEVLDQLHSLAIQKIQSDIASDQMWINYNPLIIAGVGCVLVGILLIILANETLKHHMSGYNGDTRIYINMACVIGLIICLMTIIGFGFGWMMAFQDYIFKTHSPDAAAYQQVIYYLYYGVSR